MTQTPDKSPRGAKCLLALAILGIANCAALVALKCITPEQGWVLLACSAGLAIISQFHRVTQFSGLGLTAQMQATMAEADATIKDARELFATFGNAVLTILIGSDFMGGMGTAKRFQLYSEIMSMLKEATLTHDQLDRANSGWRNGMNILFSRLFGNLATERIEAKGPHPLQRNLMVQELNRMVRIDGWKAGTPDDYEHFFSKYGLLDGEVSQWVSDYRFYLQSGQLRREREFLELVYWNSERKQEQREQKDFEKAKDEYERHERDEKKSP